MDARPSPDLVAELRASLDWWREAGVDHVFADTPRRWLIAADVEAPNVARADADSFPAVKALPPPAPPPPRALIGGDRTHWPRELAAFTDWWMTEPSLDPGQSLGRVPPRGPGNAPLMVLVPEPEAADDTTLLSGPQGRLLGAMLAAMGITADQVYFASALPRHTPMADWADLAVQGLGDVLRHHLLLARPQRLIAFGRHIPPLLAPGGLAPSLARHSLTQTVPILPHISHEGGSIPLLVARDLGSLLDRPIAKGNFWQQWLEWSGE